MVESLAVVGLILSMIRPPQPYPQPYPYQYPTQPYYYQQERVNHVPYPQRYPMPQGQVYPAYQHPQNLGTSYWAPGEQASYYYGQPPQATAYQAGY